MRTFVHSYLYTHGSTCKQDFDSPRAAWAQLAGLHVCPPELGAEAAACRAGSCSGPLAGHAGPSAQRGVSPRFQGDACNVRNDRAESSARTLLLLWHLKTRKYYIDIGTESKESVGVPSREGPCWGPCLFLYTTVSLDLIPWVVLRQRVGCLGALKNSFPIFPMAMKLFSNVSAI